MTGVSEIRSAFSISSARRAMRALSPLVPRNDPTLMFTNSGTWCSSRTCSPAPRSGPQPGGDRPEMRAGGKHNDLDNVGYTAAPPYVL